MSRESGPGGAAVAGRLGAPALSRFGTLVAFVSDVKIG